MDRISKRKLFRRINIMPNFKSTNFDGETIKNIETKIIDNVETLVINCLNGNTLKIYPSTGHGLEYHEKTISNDIPYFESNNFKEAFIYQADNDTNFIDWEKNFLTKKGIDWKLIKKTKDTHPAGLLAFTYTILYRPDSEAGIDLKTRCLIH